MSFGRKEEKIEKKEKKGSKETVIPENDRLLLSKQDKQFTRANCKIASYLQVQTAEITDYLTRV